MWRTEEWIGRSEERQDELRVWPAEAFHAALDRTGPPPKLGDPLPPLWSRLYGHGALRRADLAADGRPERGAGLTPPATEPRRLAAAGRWVARRPLVLGKKATCRESIAAIERKTVKSGTETRLTLRREAMSSDGPAETEEEDVLFRAPPANTPLGPIPTPPGRGQWRRRWSLDAPLLFRVAALSWDADRTLYDLEFCREHEDLDGLVPPLWLLAVLMLDLAREHGPDRPIARFAWARHLTLTHREAFEIRGAPAATRDGGEGLDLWICAPGDERRVAVSGRLVYGYA